MRTLRRLAPVLGSLCAAVAVATPAQSSVFGTVADVAKFTWISPDTDADGDVLYEVEGTTPVRIDIVANPGRRLQSVTVDLVTNNNGATVHPPLCRSTFSDTLPTDLPTAVAVDFEWKAFTTAADGAAVSCTGGATADRSVKLPPGQGQVYIRVTVRQAVPADLAHVSEGQSRRLEPA